MQAARTALDNLGSNLNEVAQRHVANLKSAPHEVLEEWRCAKAEFSAHKVNLIDNETKKRMLEELWYDRVEMDAAQVKEAEREAKQKKQAVKQLKESNEEARSGLRQQAVELEQGTTKVRERMAALSAQLTVVAEATAAADELRAKTSAHDASAESARNQLREAEASLERTRTECDALTKQLQVVHGKVEEETRMGAAVSAEGDSAAAKLAALQRDAEAVAGETAERDAWYSGISNIVKQLSGISRVTADGPTVRYEFAKGTGGLDACALVVRFDPRSGDLLAAHVAPEGILRINDLEAVAIRSNNLAFLVREVQARLDGGDDAYDVLPETSKAGCPTPSSARSRRAALPTLPLPASTAGAPPTAAAASTASVASGAAAAIPTPSALPFSQPRLVAHPPPRQLAAAVASHLAASRPEGSQPVAMTPMGSAGLAPTTAAQVAPTPTPIANVVENLDMRMSMAAAAAAVAQTPGPSPKLSVRPTPGKWSRAGGEAGPSPVPESALMSGATPHPSAPPSVPPSGGEAAFQPRPMLSRTPAVPPAAPLPDTVPRATPLPDTVPKSEYRTVASAGPLSALPSGLKLADVDGAALSEIGSARHQDPSRRSSRRSFCRSVAQPRSPCSRAARAGSAMDARSLISEVTADAAAEVYLTVRDVLGELQSTILTDGTVLDPRGEVIMYIEADGTVGGPNLEYVGEVTAPGMGGTSGLITRNAGPTSADGQDVHIGDVDYGLATIRDPNGSTVASISRAGEVNGHTGSRCGVIEGFSFEAMRVTAAYLMLVDPAMIHGK